ncbi:MAG: hypothetical protein V8S14_07775 [Lachnospiraceae bacterium]
MIYEYWYAGISGLNCMKKKKLREILKTAEMIYYIEEIKLTELGILTDRRNPGTYKSKKTAGYKRKMGDAGREKYPFYSVFFGRISSAP